MKTTRMKRSKLGRLASEITKDEIKSWFHLPAEEACVRLGVSLTVMKKLCRGFGIQRWPYRKVASIKRLIHNFHSGTCSDLEGGGDDGGSAPQRTDSATASRSPSSSARPTPGGWVPPERPAAGTACKTRAAARGGAPRPAFGGDMEDGMEQEDAYARAPSTCELPAARPAAPAPHGGQGSGSVSGASGIDCLLNAAIEMRHEEEEEREQGQRRGGHSALAALGSGGDAAMPDAPPAAGQAAAAGGPARPGGAPAAPVSGSVGSADGSTLVHSHLHHQGTGELHRLPTFEWGAVAAAAAPQPQPQAEASPRHSHGQPSATKAQLAQQQEAQQQESAAFSFPAGAAQHATLGAGPSAAHRAQQDQPQPHPEVASPVKQEVPEHVHAQLLAAAGLGGAAVAAQPWRPAAGREWGGRRGFGGEPESELASVQSQLAAIIRAVSAQQHAQQAAAALQQQQQYGYCGRQQQYAALQRQYSAQQQQHYLQQRTQQYAAQHVQQQYAQQYSSSLLGLRPRGAPAPATAFAPRAAQQAAAQQQQGVAAAVELLETRVAAAIAAGEAVPEVVARYCLQAHARKLGYALPDSALRPLRSSP